MSGVKSWRSGWSVWYALGSQEIGFHPGPVRLKPGGWDGNVGGDSVRVREKMMMGIMIRRRVIRLDRNRKRPTRDILGTEGEDKVRR